VGDRDMLSVEPSEAIATVRAELERAIEEGERSALAFRAGPIEMELQVSFSKTGSAGAGVRAWVVSAETNGELPNSATHRPTPSLTPGRRHDGTDPERVAQFASLIRDAIDESRLGTTLEMPITRELSAGKWSLLKRWCDRQLTARLPGAVRPAPPQ
jgi:hypothetical protein